MSRSGGGNPPAIKITDVVTHFAVAVNEERGDGQTLDFLAPGEDLRLELLTDGGEPLRQADTIDGRLLIDTADLQPGTYVLRATRPDDAERATVELRTVPPLR